MKNFKWTEENTNFLVNNYAKGAPYCSKELGTTIGSIHMKANRLGIRSRRNQRRTPVEYEMALMSIEANYVPLEPYIDSHTSILHECFNGHISKIKPYIILAGKGCIQCENLKRTKSHEQYLIDLDNLHDGVTVLDSYINSATPIRHKCKHGHVWWVRPSGMLKPSHTSHCPDCANYSFKPSKPAILYYIKIQKYNLIYYKVGITNRSVQERFKTEPKHTEIIVLKETPYLVGEDAKIEEQRILKEYTNHRQNIPELLVSGGNTELFEFDILGLDT